ncbi:DUF4147 domain-containing protein [Candidatus Kaiserbacteria bacterium]|nr:DUF4147 domain-containing protein [Candidatus Kaiserbacteria bacterium]
MSRIKNAEQLATTPLRKDALAIAEAAFDAIDTETVIRARLAYSGSTLTIDGTGYDLNAYKRIMVLGFGKASCKAVQTIEGLLRERITKGVAIDVHAGVCDIVEVAQGSHPRPSAGNVEVSERMVALAREAGADDLVIVVVSGGGSSLLCWPAEECDQGGKLYDDAKRVGMTIAEMNTVRRHVSAVKGGGLAAVLYPATVLSLVFCDVPGDHFEDVASGPTFYDTSTIADAQAILDRYQLTGYTLTETPKDKSLFDKVTNLHMVSNSLALTGMAAAAAKLGYRVVNVGSALYDEPQVLIQKMRAEAGEKLAVIAGGESRLSVARAGGKGGRCQYIALAALSQLAEHELLLPFASDGIDNSDTAGAIADSETKRKLAEKNISVPAALESFDTYHPLEASGDILFTGQTDANVSDLYIFLRM